MGGGGGVCERVCVLFGMHFSQSKMHVYLISKNFLRKIPEENS